MINTYIIVRFFCYIKMNGILLNINRLQITLNILLGPLLFTCYSCHPVGTSNKVLLLVSLLAKFTKSFSFYLAFGFTGNNLFFLSWLTHFNENSRHLLTILDSRDYIPVISRCARQTLASSSSSAQGWYILYTLKRYYSINQKKHTRT